mgnify:CR=1 FL=1
MDTSLQISFGMAFSSMSMQSQMLDDFLLINQFSSFEFPWEIIFPAGQYLSILSIPDKVRKLNKSLICGGIMEERLTCEIPFADEKMRQHFTQQLISALKKLSQVHVYIASLECPLENIIGDETATASLQEILRAVAPILISENMILLLPLRMPSNIAPDVVKFLRDTMIPNIKLRLDIHPWDLHSVKNPEIMAGRLNFETKVITFRYDADCGYKIKKTHLAPVRV